MRGQIGTYYWGQYEREKPELNASRVIGALCQHLIGCFGVNVSFNSGKLGDRVPVPDGWTRMSGFAVSPRITDRLARSWIQSEDPFDEWYFFREVPANICIQSYCNWHSFRLDQWQILSGTENGFDLSMQLEKLQPDVVIGEGRGVYVISRDVQIVDTFLELAHEP
jgi:hypothetical protein